MLRRRGILLAVRRRLPALARRVGLDSHDLGVASLVVTARPNLAVRELNPGLWLVSDPLYEARSGTAPPWRHVPVTAHAHLLVDPVTNAANLCAATTALYTQNSELHTSFLIDLLGIGCVIEASAASSDFAVGLRKAGYNGVIVTLVQGSRRADLLARNAVGDAKWHVIHAVLGAESGGFTTSEDGEPVPVRLLGEVVDAVLGDVERPRLLINTGSVRSTAEVLAGVGARLADIAAVQACVTNHTAAGDPRLGAAIAELEATSGLAVTGLFPRRCEETTGRLLEIAVLLAHPALSRPTTGQTVSAMEANGAQAEISEVWARDEMVSIVFSVEPTGPTAMVNTLVLRLRGREGFQHFAVRKEQNGLLHADIPIASLDSGARPVDEIWDVFAEVRRSGKEQVEVRVGKHLDDIEGKKRIITFPSQRPAGDESFAVTPYYTLHDNLSIRCRGAARKG